MMWIINRLFPSGARATDWNHCSRSVLRFICWSFWKGRGRRTHRRVFPCIDINLQFLKCPFQSVVKRDCVYFHQLIENVGTCKMFFFFVWSVLCFNLLDVGKQGQLFLLFSSLVTGPLGASGAAPRSLCTRGPCSRHLKGVLGSCLWLLHLQVGHKCLS